MAIPKRLGTPGTYFITTTTFNRRRLFHNPATAALLLAALQHYRGQGCYKLHAFVVMPDHLHLLFTPKIIPVERAMMLIKGGFSHRLQAAFPTWQRGFTDHRIRDQRTSSHIMSTSITILFVLGFVRGLKSIPFLGVQTNSPQRLKALTRATQAAWLRPCP